jgi:hypothetical protein
MNWRKLADTLIPVAASLTGNVAVIAAGNALESAINAHLNNQAATTGKTRDELLAEYQAAWDKDVSDADALLHEGHQE